MAEKAESKPTPRVVLMEFDLPSVTLEGAAGAPEEIIRALVEQIGNADGALPEKLTVLVQVAESEGGPKAVIERDAKTRGRFRAIAKDSFDQGHEAIPPEQQKFELKPL